MKKRTLSLAFAVLAASQLGATNCGQVIRDPGFDLWCGDQLCTWKLVRGDIKRVGTWHEGDSGIEFVGDDAAISQLSPVNSFDGDCIRFSLVSDVEETAEVFLDVDLEGDGTVDQHERIATSHWKPVSFLIHVAAPYDGIRFELDKHGTGKAVLAQIAAELSDECDGLPTIDAGPRPNGAVCVDATDCASSLCVFAPTSLGMVCGGCNLAGPACGGGQVCGLGDALSPVLAVPLACVAAGSAQLAEQCITDAECASGKCDTFTGLGLGVCSACKVDADCTGPSPSCQPSWLAESHGPSVCEPGQRLNPAGTGCGADADCASGHCTGSERKVCNDTRPCESPANCPVDSGLAPGACTTVGIQGGTCD